MNLSVYGLLSFSRPDAGPTDLHRPSSDARERVAARNDINWHRTFLWVSGFFYNPKFRYTVSVWSLPSTSRRWSSA